MGDATQTLRSAVGEDDDDAPDWALVVALDCDDVGAAPARVSLGGVDEVEIGRGDARAWSRRGRRLRLDLDDASASQRHARLARHGDGWRVEDAGSKNGTRVNGKRVPLAPLGDGDVVECGATFLVLRRATGSVRDLDAPVGPTPLLQTLSPRLERELEPLPKIAQSRVPLLVRGESGTGKEVVASAIHALSRRPGAFTPVNCGAIPATLVESELFGSRRGAFSGAEDRPGLVRNADRGTLFLDEIAELPPPSQAALLRVLQDGEVLPLGAGKPLVVDVRIVAATHRNLEALVDAGSFRRDLYARLRGYELVLPPLAARLEDLGVLCTSLLSRLPPSASRRRLSRAAARALFGHRWPFNVRELEQVLRAAIAVAGERDIAAEDLRLAAPLPPATAPAPSERDRLETLLVEHGGNLSAIARALTTSRTQVARLLARHGLDAAGYKSR